MNVLKTLMAALRHAETQLEATVVLVALAIAWQVMGMDAMVNLNCTHNSINNHNTMIGTDHYCHAYEIDRS